MPKDKWQQMTVKVWHVILSFLTFGEHIQAERATKWIRDAMRCRLAWPPVWHVKGACDIDMDKLLGVNPRPLGVPCSLSERWALSGCPVITELQINDRHAMLPRVTHSIRNLTLCAPRGHFHLGHALEFWTGKAKTLDVLELKGCVFEDISLRWTPPTVSVRNLRVLRCNFNTHNIISDLFSAIRREQLEDVTIEVDGKEDALRHWALVRNCDLEMPALKTLRLHDELPNRDWAVPYDVSWFPPSIQRLDLSCKMTTDDVVNVLFHQENNRLGSLQELVLPNLITENERNPLGFLYWMFKLPSIKRVDLRGSMTLSDWQKTIKGTLATTKGPVFVVSEPDTECTWPVV